MTKYPQIKIRSVAGGRYAVRWIERAGRQAHRAIVPSQAAAVAVREAVRGGRDGWAAAWAAVEPAPRTPDPDAIETIRRLLAAFPDVPESSLLDSLQRGAADYQAKIERSASREHVRQRIDPIVAVRRSSLGGKASAAKMTPEERSARARKAIAARWARVRLENAAAAPTEAPGEPEAAGEAPEAPASV